jgi:predicted ferric reductase
MLESMKLLGYLEFLLVHLLLMIGYIFTNDLHFVCLISLRIFSQFIYLVLILLLVVVGKEEAELVENEVKTKFEHNSKGRE